MTWPSTLLWATVLVAGVWVAHWGANRIAAVLKTLRRRWGLTSVGGGAIVGLALAMPEVSITASSVLLNASDVGLGLMVGGNVLSLPLLTSIAYLASGRAAADGEIHEDEDGEPRGGAADEERTEGWLWISSRAEGVAVLPYLVIVALVAALTLPAPWRGLQPVDGWLMLGVYAVYLAQSVLRGKGSESTAALSTGDVVSAVAGLLAVMAAAAAIVHSTDRLVQAFGVSPLVGGLFITAPVGLAPEAFGTWGVTRRGHLTAGTVDVITDGAVTMTIAFFPLALVTTSLSNFPLYLVSVAFAVAMPATLALLLVWQPNGYGLARWQVLAFDALYLVYVAVVVGWVL